MKAHKMPSIRKIIVNIAILSIPAATLFGCTKTCVETGECECIDRFDCAEDFYCDDGKCVEESKAPWIVPEKQFGETCMSDIDCISGFCLPLGPSNGGVCTVKCDTQNPCIEGWSCKILQDSESGDHVCVQDIPSRLCLPCSVDGHCNAVGDLCVTLPEGDHICAQDCSLTEDCPQGFECVSVSNGERSLKQCTPIGNSCECGEVREGMSQLCELSNAYGVCSGRKTCSKIDGKWDWTTCDANIPMQEVCNGYDDDCDGLVDNLDPSLDHSDLAPEFLSLYPRCYVGGCAGRWQCRETSDLTVGWECDAGDPENEICNGMDDNCNGEVDETFLDENGLYVHPLNCGNCGASCEASVAHLLRDSEGNVVENAVSCEIRNGEPRCVPYLCEPGFYPYPHEAPILCSRLISPACQSCGVDADCGVYSDVCMHFGGEFGLHCGQSCDVDSPYAGCTGKTNEQSCCPDGFTCQLQDQGLRCIPDGGSCTCTEENAGLERNCIVTSASDICQGRQVCQKLSANVYAWSECSTEQTTLEVCDHQDNNCNGEIDEGFVDDKGRYFTEEHCGECNEDCPSHWKAKELHAEGACLLVSENYSCEFTGCKLEKQIVGKKCSQDIDCGTTAICDPQIHYCVEENDTGVSCSKTEDCKSLSSAHECLDGVCQVTFQYYNSNGIMADGCECGVAVQDGIDEPDTFSTWPDENAVYVDRDCDGIDGNIETSLFVNAKTDSSKGTIDHPYATIEEAIKAFNPQKHSAILVASGTYYENIELKSGLKIYGGYSNDFRSRNIVLYPTQIVGAESSSENPGVIYVPALSARTIISGFTLQGYDVNAEPTSPGQPGIHSYVVYLAEASNKLVLRNNAILGGRGGNASRSNPGADGANGENGLDGKDSKECSSDDCHGETNYGGEGGKNSYCASANGNRGATARDYTYSPQDFGYGSELNGFGGTFNRYIHSYPDQDNYCKYDCQITDSSIGSNGGDGSNGADGSIGSGGSGCSNAAGSVKDGIWLASKGSAGKDGTAAHGGGGGGAGGAAKNENAGTGCTIGKPLGDLGGSGGGGGAGGCGGTGGNAGASGGGSFGIWIAKWNSAPVISGNRIVLGHGGIGAAGGAGGVGGAGGIGGKGGIVTAVAWCAGEGGSGGNGGVGGAGGGGGGGCGGSVFGIAGVADISALEKNNAFEYPENENCGGAGGEGGASPAGDAHAGQKGTSGLCTFVKSF